MGGKLLLFSAGEKEKLLFRTFLSTIVGHPTGTHPTATHTPATSLPAQATPAGRPRQL
jgi:hypothetical protein